MMKRALVFLACVFAVGAVYSQDVNLPAPKDNVGLDLMDAIRARSVSRSFTGQEIPLTDLSTILWAGNGQRSATDVVSGASKAMRTIPYSGDNAYIDLYVLDSHGAYMYLPEKAALKKVGSRDVRDQITPELIKGSSVMILFAYDDAKVPSFLKKNPTMVVSMMNGTAGFAAENIGLAAAAFKVSTITMYNLKGGISALLCVSSEWTSSISCDRAVAPEGFGKIAVAILPNGEHDLFRFEDRYSFHDRRPDRAYFHQPLCNASSQRPMSIHFPNLYPTSESSSTFLNPRPLCSRTLFSFGTAMTPRTARIFRRTSSSIRV